MTEYNVRELQLRIIGNLMAVDKVCREHGLHYYIYDGTMLGAVRHGGFIPWDDDLDIAMPREDYEYHISVACTLMFFHLTAYPPTSCYADGT